MSSVSRRHVLLGTAATASTALLRGAAAQPKSLKLVAAPARAAIAGGPHPETAVWAYDGKVPGPEIRLKQGERARIVVENRLPQATTVHWHGVRVPNAMDGVPHLTQKPIGRGESFLYEFEALDAGTFWYHPHENSSEQVGRGLAGAFIVEEREPVAVDRDVTWMLGDWRLERDAQLAADFGSFFDMSHAGRIGNTVTINGKVPESFAVQSGERMRLRLVNVANARIFGLELQGLKPMVVALDGHAVEPHEPPGGRVVLGPAMRADLILDCIGAPNDRSAVIDDFYRNQAYRLVDLVYAETKLREAPLAAPLRLPANALAEPDLAKAVTHRFEFAGGMMGQMREAILDGKRVSARDLMARHRLAWTINGVALRGHTHAPALTLQRGKSYLFEMHNDTAWHHPMHLHGHAFRVVARNGEPTRYKEWQDTVLMAPRERVAIAFVADNPGDWMFHCHVLEHQAAGMMAMIRVT